MLIQANNSCLLVVDIQEKLAPAIDDHKTLLENACWITDIANRLHIPVLASEQYPQGLGETLEPLKQRIPREQTFAKLAFACSDDSACDEVLQSLRCEQVIIIGMEAHVCVLQTALRLQQQGREVFVVRDCVGSRKPADKDAALERLRDNGVTLVTREMVAFEWLRKAGDERFRQISREFLR
ncbi:hydrolase [Marinobacterium lutimaris]|uniref:Nicotinamidase-related amidase n=1 Tax=Marinobacterium lutimaris TaxID=568106 RepID=A0A1H5WF48_9GAMM|nr:hydrolase [Marinobacterium lutimaris]SEF98003.1 Nicotinamidase-related amidase [Marinobacterium lutimaris]